LAAARAALDHPLAPALVVGMALDHVQRPDDHGQQVVEVVGHPAGQLADGLQLLRLEEGGLGGVALGHGGLDPFGQQLVDAGQLGLGLLGVGGVEGDADEADEVAVGPEARLRERLQPAPRAVGPAIAALQVRTACARPRPGPGP
jgi:hypothetical protein